MKTITAPPFPHSITASGTASACRSRLAFWVPLLGAACLAAGCTTYHPLPLTPRDTAMHDVRQLTLNHQRVDLPGLAPHPFDPARPLDMTDVAILAVANNPDLKLARADSGIAHAQAFSAGLLPDPQFNLTRDFPSASGLVSAFNAGLSFDFTSLITLSARRNASDADQRKADLVLLWQEWQAVAQARKLFVDVVFLDRSTELQRQSLALAEQRVQAAQQAIQAGNATLDALTPYLVAQEDARRQLDDQTRQRLQARHALNAFLGLAPEVHLDLAPPSAYPALDAKGIRQALENLPNRRPDLLALSAGYQAQEARLRAAVLAQFPSLNFGITRARDTAASYTRGFTASISLPIFNRNRGNISIETATRARLHDEYQNRVNTAYADVALILDDQKLVDAQMRATTDAVATLARTAEAADAAYRAHSLTLNAYVDLQSSLRTKRADLLALQRTSMQQRIALQSLLGGEMPQAGASNTSSPSPSQDPK